MRESSIKSRGRMGQKGGIYLFLAFLLPFLILLSIFVLKEIYPFGDRSFLFSDMWHQYMPFFTEFVRKIRAGEGLSYSYKVGIGSNFLALYVYYLASPLHWLALLVPEKFLMEFMSYLVVVKTGLCGLTFYYYLREHFGIRERKIIGTPGEAGEFGGVFFGCFYAFSGFMTAYNWNIMWLDCVILLPLILLGLERLVKEGRCTLYCIALALSIFTNYYISIMICLFLVLYFLVLLLMEKRSFRAVWQFALFSLLAGGMAAALLVPEVLAILKTDFGDMDFPKKVESYFSILDVLARHCMGVVTERGLNHWPNIYCGTAAFLLLPLYTLCDRIPARRRFGYLALAGVLLASFSFNFLDFIWHGMNYPDSLPARQSFLYIFLILVMCYGAYRHLGEIPRERVIHTYVGAVVFLLFVEKFVEQEHFELGVEWLNLAFVTAYAILLYLFHNCGPGLRREILTAVCLTVVIAEVGINTYFTSVGTTSRSQYLNPLPNYQELYETAQERALEQEKALDPDFSGQVFFRMEKFSRKTKNDGTLAGYPTASVFSSTMNSYVMDLYQRWGMRHSKVYYCYDGATFFTSALLNVRYLYGEDGQEEGPLYRLLDTVGGISLYEVAETLPFGYVVPAGYELSSGYDNDGLRLQNNMVRRLGIEEDLFVKTEDGGRKESISVTAEEEGYYYGILTASGTKEIKVTGDAERDLKDLKKGSVLYLGYLQEGDGVTLENGDEEDETPSISVDVYRMEEEVLSQALAMLQKEHLTHVEYDSTHLSGEIDLSQAGRLILSIPLEDGWTVEVDGKETEPGTFGGTLIALELEAGHHSLQMYYVPQGKYEGLAVSGLSIVIFVLVTLAMRGKKKRGMEEEHGASEEYAGDAEADADGGELESGDAGENADGRDPDIGDAEANAGDGKSDAGDAGEILETGGQDSHGGAGLPDHGGQP